MNISKANAATLGHILADALHQCDNLAERKGVLRARDEIQDILSCSLRDGVSFTTDAEWRNYSAFMGSFRERINQLECLTPTDDR